MLSFLTLKYVSLKTIWIEWSMYHILTPMWTVLGSGNDLSPVCLQAITWTNSGLFLTGLLGRSFSERWIGIFFIFIQQDAFENVVCHNDGGGVAITVRNDINQNTQLVDDLENNNNQEIIWIQINLNRRNKIYASVYYGKQENTPADEVEREMSQLRAHITKLRPKGHIILTVDFNAKININQEEAKQSSSRNGIKLEETLEDLQLTAISTKSKTGTWTRVPWNKKETKSVIDYIVIKKEDEKLVTDNIVDEAESIKIQGTNKSDHNTLCLALKIPHTNESTTITRWKLKNEEGWKYFNEELRKIETEGQLSYNQMEKSIKCILEITIGKTRIKTNRPSRGKETETIKALRKDLREKRKAFNTATRKNKNKYKSMKAYIQSQAKLKEGIEKEHRENIRDLAKRISKEGGTKSQLFWK